MIVQTFSKTQFKQVLVSHFTHRQKGDITSNIYNPLRQFSYNDLLIELARFSKDSSSEKLYASYKLADYLGHKIYKPLQ